MKFHHLFLILVVLLVAACGPAGTAETPVPATLPATTAPQEDVIPRPTVTPGDSEGQSEAPGYPALPTAQPTPDGYPAPLPTLDPYPAVEGYVWMLRPAGVQCDEGQPTTIQDVTAELTAANITTNVITTVSMNVCQACGCPSSVHFRAQVKAEDVGKAEAIGWLNAEAP